MREKLKCLIDEATTLLDTQGEFFSQANKAALTDVLDHARQVYAGTYRIPFTRNREFSVPRSEEDVLFAIEHNTMIPLEGVTKYGLQQAIEWFKGRHIMLGDICHKAEEAATAAQAFLGKISLGTGVGEYSAAQAKELEATLADLKGKSGEELGKAIVRLQDALRGLRHSRVLRAQTEANSHLFLTGYGFERLRQNVQKDDALRKVLDKVRKVSDHYTPEQIRLLGLYHGEHIDYGELNRQFSIWSKSESVINFVSPKNAKYARIMFTLPSCENEAEGLGHIWLDDVKVYSVSSGKWDLDNPGFEEGGEIPAHWKAVAHCGNPIVRSERRKPYCGSGEGSVYMENPTEKDCGGVINDRDIPVCGEMTNTITFLAKIDGKLKKGLNVIVIFKDEQGDEIERFEYLFNRKSALVAKQFVATAQADAIMYAFTGDTTYAQKAKEQLLFILDDFCQGIEFWMVYHLRPQGDDSYGAVQGGRVISAFASAYMLIRDSGVITAEEKKRMVALLEYFVRNLLDLRDRTELSDEEAQAGTNNWNTSMASGVGLLMMAMPEFPNAAQWLDNANKILKAQLHISFNADGSYPESIRYHHAALDWQTLYAKALFNCTGEDWYPELVKMFRFGLKTHTPPYAYYDGMISMPNFGDSDLCPGKRFYVYGLHCEDVYRIDRQTGGFMYESWCKSGKATAKISCMGEEVILLNFLYPYGGLGEGETLAPLASTGEFSDYGIYIFRKNYGEDNECYCAVLANSKPIWHGHYDQGSFIIYHNNVPMIVDPGIEGYFDSTRDWYLSSSAHATLQFSSGLARQGAQAIDVTKEQHVMTGFFSAQQGFTDTPRTSEVLDFKTSDTLDEITIKIQNPEGKGVHIRTISFYRDTGEYVIRDRVEEFGGKVRVSLPVAATDYTMIGSGMVCCKGHFGVDVRIEYEKPSDVDIHVDWGRGVTVCPPVDGENKLLYVRAETEQNEIVTRLRFCV